MIRATFAAVRLGLTRLRAHPGPAVALTLTMAALVAVWVAIPLYAESATSRLLSEQVGDDVDDVPFGYLVSYNRLSGGNRDLADLEALTAFLNNELSATGVDIDSSQRLVETVPFDLYASTDLARADTASPVDRLSFVALSDTGQATVVDGRFPQSRAGSLEIMLHRSLAEEIGVEVGQSMTVVNQRKQPEEPGWSLDALIAGLWVEQDADDRTAAGRFVASGAARSAMVVTDEAMAEFIDGLAPKAVARAQWLVLLDPNRVRSDNLDDVLSRADGVGRSVDERLSGARVLVTPEAALQGFEADVARLERGLRSFSLPTLGLMLVATGALIAMHWQRRDGELTMLRRRGIGVRPLMVAAAAEALILTVLAVVVGALGASLVARFVARTESFLRFGDGVALTLVQNRRTQTALVVVAVLLFIVQLAPAVRLVTWAARTRKRTATTRSDAPWWQRRFIDAAFVTMIGVYATVALSVSSPASDLLTNAVVVLLPALVAVAAALVVLRLFPLLMAGVARVAGRFDRTALLLAARRAARQRATRAAPLLLLIVTGALSIFTASLARTLDAQLVDATYHQVGAASSVDADTPSGAVQAVFDRAGLGWGPAIDPEAFDRVWGLDDVTRVARVPGRAERAGGGVTAIDLLAVDPETFATTAFWRDDYARRSLDELMASLQLNRDAVLVPNEVMAANGLRIGDQLVVSVTNGRSAASMPMVIVGTFSQFPMWTPGQGSPPLVGSLAELERRVGQSMADHVLFGAADPGRADDGQTRADLARLGVSSTSVDRAETAVDEALLDPARQGVFGLLTLGFVVSTALTLSAFVVYSVFEFKSQRSELGVLRALGLRQRDLVAAIGLDLFFLVAVGLASAVLIGFSMARWLLPRLLEGTVATVPDLLIEFDRGAGLMIVAGLAAAFVIAFVILLVALRRIRLFEAVKLGALT